MNAEWWGVLLTGFIGIVGIVISLKANGKADRANRLAEQIQDENVKLKAAVLTVVGFESGTTGSLVTVHNNGDTRAEDIWVRLDNDHSAACANFEPRPLKVIEGRGDGRFSCGLRPEDFTSGKVLSTDLRVTWKSPLGVEQTETYRFPPTLRFGEDVMS